MKIKENSFNVGIKACLAFNTCSIFSSQASESVLIAEHINLYDWKFYAFIPCFKRYATQVYDILFSCQFCFRSIFFTTTGCMQAVAPIQIINNFAVIVTNSKLFWWHTIQSLIWQKSNCSHDHYQMFAEKTPITLLTYVTL